MARYGSLFEYMFLLFLGLKLADLIDWSWWKVCSPLWLPIFGGFVFLLIHYLYAKISLWFRIRRLKNKY